MSLFTIKHVHEGEVKVNHVTKSTLPPTDDEQTKEESVKENNAPLDVRAMDIYFGLGISILSGVYFEVALGEGPWAKIIMGVLGALFVLLAIGYRIKRAAKIVKCMECILWVILVLVSMLILIGFIKVLTS